MTQQIDFKDTVIKCLDNQDLVSEFNRLTGCNIGRDNRKPIEIAVDQATGYDQVKKWLELQLFIAFVHDTIWLPITSEAS